MLSRTAQVQSSLLERHCLSQDEKGLHWQHHAIVLQNFSWGVDHATKAFYHILLKANGIFVTRSACTWLRRSTSAAALRCRFRRLASSACLSTTMRLCSHSAFCTSSISLTADDRLPSVPTCCRLQSQHRSQNQMREVCGLWLLTT